MTKAGPTPPAPLTDVRVLEWTASPAGQSAGMLLADLGADVVRAAPADDVRPIGLPGWLCWNRGKTLVAAGDDPDRLLDRADVLLTDAPGALRAARGHAGADLRARAPGLVSVWLPPAASPYHGLDLPHDQLLLDAVSGFASNQPATEDRPVAAVVPSRPLVQGALGAVAALAGLMARARDGWGRAATVTGLHAEAATLATMVSASLDGPPKLSYGRSPRGVPNFRFYQGSDGGWFFLGALSLELFIRALEVVDRLDLFAWPGVEGEFFNLMKPELAAAVGGELEAAFAERPASEWLRRFEDGDVPAAALGDPDRWLRGDVLAHACPPVRRDQPDVGEVIVPGAPLALSAEAVRVGTLPTFRRRAPVADVWSQVAPVPPPSGDPPGESDRPLTGLRVLDAATFVAAPFVSTLLAAHGADVVKVEAPTGDPYAIYTASYAIVNEHKERLPLNLREEAGRAAFLELVAVADVAVDNLTAASLDRLGLPPERFEAANPALVRCSVTAYGEAGPYVDLPGFDQVVQTLSGMAAVQGGDGRPIVLSAPTLDIATGCVGALGTLAALWSRRRTGRGQRVSTSLAGISTYLQSGELTTYGGRPERPVGGPDFPGPSAWQRFYRAADGWIAVSATTHAQRLGLLEAVGLAGLLGLDDGARAAAVAEAVEQDSCARWRDRLIGAGVPACVAVERGHEVEDPFLAEQDFFHVVDTPHVGRLLVAGGWTDWSHVARRPPHPADALDADHAAVLARWTPPG